jgi:hypothetical protein
MPDIQDLKDYFDHILIYPCEENGQRLVIAHSIRTDQIGVSRTVDEAIFELLKAIHELLAEWKKDKEVRVLQQAPADVNEKFLSPNIRPIPHYILESAINRFHEFLKGDLTWHPDEDDLPNQANFPFYQPDNGDEPLYGNIAARDVAGELVGC